MFIPKWLVALVGVVLLYPLVWGAYAAGKVAGQQEGAARASAELARVTAARDRNNEDANECVRQLTELQKQLPTLQRQ